MEHTQKSKQVRTAIALILFGLVFIAFAWFFLRGGTAQWLEATAEITDKTSHYDSDDGWTADVSVRYRTQSGETLEGEFSNFGDDAEIGDTFPMLYRADDPSFICTEGGQYAPYIALAVGIITVILGSVTLGKALRRPDEEPEDTKPLPPCEIP